MSNHSLNWGTSADDELYLTGSDLDGDYWFETLAESATFGDPQPVEVGLTSLLLDGTRKQMSRHDNRNPAFRVVVKSATAVGLAEGEAELWRMAQRVGTVLTWTPPDVFGAATVLEVETTSMAFLFDDLSEKWLERTYQLSWDCQPFARSVDITVQPAVSTDESLTIVDDCSSATGWSSLESAPVASSGAVVTTEVTGDKFAGMKRSGAISMGTNRYLVIDWTTSANANAIIFGHEADEVLRTSSPFGAAWKRSYYYLPSGITSPDFIAAPLPVGGTLSITQIATTKSLPDSGTGGHQQLLSIAPGGSARTQAQIEITTPTQGLGEVTLYTCPSGSAYTPTIRRWLVSSDTVISNAAGSYQTITGASVFEIPVSTLLPGGYAVWARMAATTTVDVPINWNAGSWVNGVAVGDSQGDLVTRSFVANEWKMYPLGLVTLPPAKVGPAGMVRIGIQRGSGSATVYLYDVFLFHESGDLTVVQCGLGTSTSGGPSRRVRVLPPSAENPGGRLERGYATDWSDAFSAGTNASSRPARGHVLHPDGTSAFVFTEGTPNASPASVSAQWYKRWHTHAVD